MCFTPSRTLNSRLITTIFEQTNSLKNFLSSNAQVPLLIIHFIEIPEIISVGRVEELGEGEKVLTL